MNDVAFSWQGAFTAFIAFQASIGLTIAKKTYKAFYEDNTRAAGAGHALSYLIQISITTLGAGIAVGTSEQLRPGSKAGNIAIVTAMAIIYIWAKLFSDSRLLRCRCIRLGERFISI